MFYRVRSPAGSDATGWALPIADRVLLMDHGQVAYSGTPQDLAGNEELLWRHLAVRSVA